MEPRFSPPNPEDTKRLACQWLSVSRLAEKELSRPLDQSLGDLAAIQRLLDEEVIDRDTYALQCLGVALGRVMIRNIQGLDWWMVEDEYGRDPCLRYLATTIQFNPLTMISKRVERGEDVDVKHLFEQSRVTIAAMKDRYGHETSN
jgi:hypothetical protein